MCLIVLTSLTLLVFVFTAIGSRNFEGTFSRLGDASILVTSPLSFFRVALSVVLLFNVLTCACCTIGVVMLWKRNQREDAIAVLKSVAFFVVILFGLILRALFWFIDSTWYALIQQGPGADGNAFLMHAVVADMVILGALLMFAALAIFAFGKRTNARAVELSDHRKPLLEDEEVPKLYRDY